MFNVFASEHTQVDQSELSSHAQKQQRSAPPGEKERSGKLFQRSPSDSDHTDCKLCQWFYCPVSLFEVD